MIEKDSATYGGTCINVGRIPSKRLINDAASAPKADIAEQKLYYRNAVQDKRVLTAALRKANYDKLINAGVDVIDGTAAFVNEHQIRVSDPSGNTELIEAPKIIINTGSSPFIPPIENVKTDDRVFVSETILELEELPERLAIIGGGYIGLEFAFMYTNFGSRVTIIQDGPVLLPKEDADIAKCIRDAFEAKGGKIITEADTKRVCGEDLFYVHQGQEKKLEGDAILLATGRIPNTAGLNAEKAGIQLTSRGAVETDEHLRTSAPGIWAAGDVCGKLKFTYISLDDSRIILSDILGDEKRTTMNRGAFSYSVFIDPPLARVGIGETDAEKQGLGYRIVQLPAAAIPKTKVIRQPVGMLKAIIDNQTKAILGASLFCAESHELINMIKLVMDKGLDYTVLSDFIFTHPTMAEGLNDLFA